MPVLKIRHNGKWITASGGSGGDSISGGDADTLDGKHANEFASASDVSRLKNLVGNTSVSDQIETALENYSGGSGTDSTHTNCAPANHTHSEYALNQHEHAEYAPYVHTHDYNDLKNKPEIPTIPEIPEIPDSLPADGGNSDTVDGKHASDFAAASDFNSLKELVGTTKVSEQIDNAISNISTPTLTDHLTEESMILTSLQYGDKLPPPGTPGRIFFLRALKGS